MGVLRKVSKMKEHARLGMEAVMQRQAIGWLRLLRHVRLAAGHDPVDAFRQVAPLLARLGEKAFDEAEPPKGQRKCVVNRATMMGTAVIPPRNVDGDNGTE